MKPKQLIAILSQLKPDTDITRIFVENTCIPEDGQLRMCDKVIIHDSKERYYPFHVLSEE